MGGKSGATYTPIHPEFGVFGVAVTNTPTVAMKTSVMVREILFKSCPLDGSVRSMQQILRVYWKLLAKGDECARWMELARTRVASLFARLTR